MGNGRTALVATDVPLRRFAGRLRAVIGAEQVLLFGPRARGAAAPDSDYDLIVVAERFRGQRPGERLAGLHELFYAEGGHAPLDLLCLTPDEFEHARQRPTLVHAVLPDAIDLLAGEGQQTVRRPAH